MASPINSLAAIQKKIDEVKRFLSVSLNIANAHTVDFYTRDVWDQFMAVPPVELLSAIISDDVHKRVTEHNLSHRNGKTCIKDYVFKFWAQKVRFNAEFFFFPSVSTSLVFRNTSNIYRNFSLAEEAKTTFGFCDDTKRLVDVAELLEAAKAHSLPGLEVCMTRNELLLFLREIDVASSLEECREYGPCELII